MLQFPNINPIILSIGPVSIREFTLGPLNIHWYSLAYVFGVLIGWFYANKIIEKSDTNITKKNIEDFISWAIIGVIIGGRLGYIVFYDPVKYLSTPISILKTYEGGMSFHGGLAGLIISAYLFCRIYKLNFINFIDILAAVGPIGLFLGRIANFINGELYGRITDVPWAMVFPDSDMQPRHPSQLYEGFFEGAVLFLILFIGIFKYKTLRIPSLNSSIFLILYSIFRITIEMLREPGDYINLFFIEMTTGQALSLPILLWGIYLLIRLKCQSIPK